MTDAPNSTTGGQCFGQTEQPAPATPPKTMIRFRYTNHEGKTAIRSVFPMALKWGETRWHPEPQWLLEAECIDRRALRTFALKDCDFTTTELTLAVDDPLAREIVTNEIVRVLANCPVNQEVDALVTWHLLFIATRATNGDILADAAGNELFERLLDAAGREDGLDADVLVDRHDLRDLLDSYRHLLWRRDDLLKAHNRYLERARAAELRADDLLPLAKRIYAAMGYEENDPWDAATERAKLLGFDSGYLNTAQKTAMTAAEAVIAYRRS